MHAIMNLILLVGGGVAIGFATDWTIGLGVALLTAFHKAPEHW
jgi:hypothetical protein